MRNIRAVVMMLALPAALNAQEAQPATCSSPVPPEATSHGSAADHADHAAHHGHAATVQAGDTSFAKLQARGAAAMGVDQYTSTHRFEPLPCGGRIELQRNEEDADGTAEIRRHLREIAEAFARGDFETPGFVHAQEVPGTVVMRERRAALRYTFRELPRGGEVIIWSNDPEAIRAVHAFLAFQRMDHRAGT